MTYPTDIKCKRKDCRCTAHPENCCTGRPVNSEEQK